MLAPRCLSLRPWTPSPSTSRGCESEMGSSAATRAGIERRRGSSIAWSEHRWKSVVHGPRSVSARCSRLPGEPTMAALPPEPVRLTTGPFSRRIASALLPVPSCAGPRGSRRRLRPAERRGVPLDVWRSFRSVAVEQAAIDRLLGAYGRSTAREQGRRPSRRRHQGSRDRGAPFWISVAGGRRLVFSSNHLNAETVSDFAAALNQFRATRSVRLPHDARVSVPLAAEQRPRRLGPATVCSSETVPESTWRLAADVLGSRLVDYYGLAERVSFAYAFEPGCYRFLPGYSYNELIPCGGGGDTDLYELVATGLWNLKMPLVRFRTGDLVRLNRGSDPIAVAYGVAEFLAVVGRMDDYLVAPDGARLMGIDHIPRGMRNVARMQVIQERRDTVRLLVVPADVSAGVDSDAIRSNAAKKLPPTMSVSVEVRSELERAPNGKIPFVVRRADL